MTRPLSILCLASYFKGNRFLERLKQESCTVYLLTIEDKLKEAWARHACDEVFAVKDFHAVLVDNGSMPLAVLDKVVDEWIARGGGANRP